MPRPLAALFALLLASPAHAGWTVEYRPSIGAGVSADGAAPLQIDNTVNLSPFGVGPRLEITTGHELREGPKVLSSGLGLRQPLFGGLSVGAHALFYTRYGGDIGYDSRLGAQGMLDWELAKWDHMGMGLHLDGGAAPAAGEPTHWWTGVGLVVRFGG